MKKLKQTNWKINNEIGVAKVRVVGPDNKQIGIMPTSEAIKLANKQGLDLVEIAPKANPPVAKIIDFGKFKYIEEKRAKKQAQKIKSELKEVRLSPFIGEADFITRVNKIKRFLKQGNKIKIVIVFKGKQMRSKQFGYDMLDKTLNQIGAEVNVDMKPKLLGRHLAMVISPTSKSKNAETKN